MGKPQPWLGRSWCPWRCRACATGREAEALEEKQQSFPSGILGGAGPSRTTFLHLIDSARLEGGCSPGRFSSFWAGSSWATKEEEEEERITGRSQPRHRVPDTPWCLRHRAAVLLLPKPPYAAAVT